jgi:hypothetical protein
MKIIVIIIRIIVIIIFALLQTGLLKTCESAQPVQCQLVGLRSRSIESQNIWEEGGGFVPEFVWTDCEIAREPLHITQTVSSLIRTRSEIRLSVAFNQHVLF